VRVTDAFETSNKLIKKGRLCEIEFAGKVIAKVRVRPADAVMNPDYRRTLAELTSEHDMENMSDADDLKILYQVYFQTVIISIEWMDPDDKKDPSLKFTEKNMVDLFTKAPKFFTVIRIEASKWTNFRMAYEEKAAGN